MHEDPDVQATDEPGGSTESGQGRINVTMELEPRSEAGGQARDVLRARLGEHLPSTSLSDLLMVVTELVNNSVEHGPGDPIQVRITADDDGSVQGEVEDQGDGLVAIRDMAGEVDGGFGLRIVETLTDRWAVYEGSTHVWFEMSAPQQPAG
jgi:two-component sensor histidine kinase